MRIGLIIYGNLNNLTGGYIYDRILVDYMQQHGHQVEIISLPQRNYGRHLLDSFARRLLADSANLRIDLLLQDELCHPSLCRINRRLRKKVYFPIVAIVHQVLCRQPRSGLFNRLYETVERPYLNSVDAFIFNSNTTRKTVEQLIEGRRPSIVAFPAGDRLGCLTSSDRIESRAKAPGPLELIFVGNLLPNKGLLPLIRGLSRLPFETWHLTVVGSPEMNRRYFRRVEKFVVAKNMKQQVVFAGLRDGHELASLLDRSHVFIMPYSHEGFGMAHLEAMGFALPVIGASSGAVKEFVTPEQNGFLIDHGDVQTMLAFLQRLNQDRQLLIKLSHAALQTFHKHPKWSDTMKGVDRFLSDLVNK
ncbi:MAG: glycosyltransferase family 4 protein [Desulfobacterales bacterium]|nr:MAG: glycosyltransferase family 4 protein [Desulfobacterales bacterium]